MMIAVKGMCACLSFLYLFRVESQHNSCSSLSYLVAISYLSGKMLSSWLEYLAGIISYLWVC